MMVAEAPPPRLVSLLGDLRPTPASYLRTARAIATSDSPDLRPVNVAVLATFTAELLESYLIVEGAARGLSIRLFFAPFNQLEQELLAPESGLYRSRPDVVVVAARLEEIAPDLVTRFVSLSERQVADEIENVARRIEALLDGLRDQSTATALVFNFAAPEHLAAGLGDGSLARSQTATVGAVNSRLGEVCASFSSVTVFDYARLVTEFGLGRWCDPKLWHTARIPFGAEGQLALGRRLSRYLRAALVPSCKCLVVDLDDTLWGGVVGEVGLGGIALGDDYPGNVFKEFQRHLLGLRDRGVLLAIASKNNEADALEVFEKHDDCILEVDDFSARQINWSDKASGLRAIARELDIGTDALAFFDDNPVEREWVSAQMPEVTVIRVPTGEPFGYVSALDESGAFDHLAISDEDRKRAAYYQRDVARRRSQAQSSSIEAFLKELQMTATVGFVDHRTRFRVTQLLAKTNQFNLTTRRHSEADLVSLQERGAVAMWLRLEDRYGDYGLVGVAIAVPAEDRWWAIDTFLLSCRALGRGVETALGSVVAQAVSDRGGVGLIAEFIPTSKNSPAKDFLRDHGFEAIDGDGRQCRRSLSCDSVEAPEFIKVAIENE